MSATSATVGDVGCFVHVGEDGDVDLFFDFLQDAQALFQAGAAKTLQGGAIGLVVRGFEDEGDVQGPGYAFDDLRHADGVIFALDDARAGDQEQRPGADADVVELEGDCHRATRS